MIDEALKLFFYRGLQNWRGITEYPLDMCLTVQDNYKKILQFFEMAFD